MNLASTVVGPGAGHDPDHVAVRLDEIALNYAALDLASAHLAGLLAERGIARGDRVGIMLPNLPHFPVCYYGALRRGAIVVPMNVLLKRREVAYYLSDSGAKLLFAWEGFAEEARAGAEQAGAECIVVTLEGFVGMVGAATPAPEIAAVDGDDTAVLLYTSGTTGQPKGAELTHANLTSNAEASRRLFLKGADAICLGALPLFHSFGQTCGMNATLGGGGTLTLVPRFEAAKALEVIQRDRVNVFLGVPTMYGAMLHLPERGDYDVSSLELCGSGGSAMPVELMRSFEQAFGCKILEGYGLSESSPVASFNHPDRERKPGSIGTPIERTEMRVVGEDGTELPSGEVGEIVIKGPNVMRGYWQRPEATAETVVDGWLHTGDMGRTDDDGYFFIVDRKKELIIRGGYNVYPREVEEVLYEHPAVREAAVLGIPDDEYGEEVGAAVSLADGAEVTPEQLREYVRARVAAYKYPREVWILDELPKGPTGKILKREIEPPSPAA
ncbi:MAG TPA: long-chain fatty acid--CoA ligase [Solirubrobacteraceae bacterium]|nr:long-chain fatty acid--CoA ligase [Solirubrobacteraceae bacterium]